MPNDGQQEKAVRRIYTISKKHLHWLQIIQKRTGALSASEAVRQLIESKIRDLEAAK